MKPCVREYFDNIALLYDKWKQKNYYYYESMKFIYNINIPKGSKVLDIGCGTGEILNHVKPSSGVGLDISENMLALARKKFRDFEFINGSAENITLNEKFDYIIMADLISYVEDIWSIIKQLKKVSHYQTRIIISNANPFWEPLYLLGEKLGLKMPDGPLNRVYIEDVINVLKAGDFIIEKKGFWMFTPKRIPIISRVLNGIFSKIPLLRRLAFIQYVIARPRITNDEAKKLTVSAIIPCYNEEDNIIQCISRIPQMGADTEIIAVNDGSKDKTAELVKEYIKTHPHVRLETYSPNRGKGYAVRTGFSAAKNDVLMIVDCDMTVPPEELPNFFEPIASGVCDATNGTRLIYPMENQAMRQLHHFGNVVFGLIFSWLFNRRITDTLCGTKVILRNDYNKVDMSQDPWGDFSILFGISQMNLRMLEVPVHYKARIAGESKMRTFHHGWILLKMCFKGFWILKLKPFFGFPPDIKLQQ